MVELDWELRLGYLIHDVSRLRRTLFDRWLSPLGITRSQWWVLAFLSRRDGRPQTELAEELEIGKVALGALIDRLEESGFVERRSDPNDRRLKRVFLTKTGSRMIETLRNKNATFNQRILMNIPRDSMDVTGQTLHAIKHNILNALVDIVPSERASKADKAEKTEKAENGKGPRARKRNARAAA